MTDLTHNFEVAGKELTARASQGRIAAINACRQLQWLVELREGENTVTLAFDEAPTMIDIAIRRRALGRPGAMDIRSISVGRKASRLFVLMPGMRVAAEPQEHGDVPPALARARARMARATGTTAAPAAATEETHTPRLTLFRVH